MSQKKDTPITTDTPVAAGGCDVAHPSQCGTIIPDNAPGVNAASAADVTRHLGQLQYPPGDVVPHILYATMPQMLHPGKPYCSTTDVRCIIIYAHILYLYRPSPDTNQPKFSENCLVLPYESLSRMFNMPKSGIKSSLDILVNAGIIIRYFSVEADKYHSNFFATHIMPAVDAIDMLLYPGGPISGEVGNPSTPPQATPSWGDGAIANGGVHDWPPIDNKNIKNKKNPVYDEDVCATLADEQCISNAMASDPTTLAAAIACLLDLDGRQRTGYTLDPDSVEERTVSQMHVLLASSLTEMCTSLGTMQSAGREYTRRDVISRLNAIIRNATALPSPLPGKGPQPMRSMRGILCDWADYAVSRCLGCHGRYGHISDYRQYVKSIIYDCLLSYREEDA